MFQHFVQEESLDPVDYSLFLGLLSTRWRSRGEGSSADRSQEYTEKEWRNKKVMKTSIDIMWINNAGEKRLDWSGVYKLHWGSGRGEQKVATGNCGKKT